MGFGLWGGRSSPIKRVGGRIRDVRDVRDKDININVSRLNHNNIGLDLGDCEGSAAKEHGREQAK